jgi:hypothetical protein
MNTPESVQKVAARPRLTPLAIVAWAAVAQSQPIRKKFQKSNRQHPRKNHPAASCA